MQNVMSIVTARWLMGVVAAALFALPAIAPAATWDSGSAVDDNWSTGTNWDGDVSPGATDSAIFDLTAEGGASGDFGSVTGYSVVDANTTVQKLIFGATGAAATTTHHVTLNTGVTLQVDGDANTGVDDADFIMVQDLSPTFTGTISSTVTITGDATFRVGAAGTHTADFVIARRPNSSGITDGDVYGNLDMSGLTTFEANVDVFTAGYSGWNGAQAGFDIALADSNTINANNINLGDTYNAGGTGGNEFLLGTTNVLNADTLYVGHGKTSVTMEFNTGLTNPTLTINDTAGTGAADLYIAYNDHNTGSNPTGVLDTTAGTINATLDQVAIGRHDAGAGGANGSFIMGDGTVTANSVVMANTSASGTSANPNNTKGTIRLTAATSAFNVAGSITDGGGVSTLQVDEGDMTIGGDMTVDTLRVGLNGGADDTTSLTVSGTNVTVGSVAAPTLLDLGRRQGDLGSSTNEIVNVLLDLSAATNFTANLTEFRVGTNDSSGGGQRRHETTILLAANSEITADKMTLGHSTAVGGAYGNKLRLGASTTLNIDEIIVGGSKSGTTLDFLAGGSTLTINGTDGAGNRADLYIGRQIGGTGGGSQGTVNGTGSTINAELDQLVIGTKPNEAGGTTFGVMTFADGLIDVNTITLGERTNAGTAGAVQGTFNFTGGTLIAGTITPGSGNGSSASDVAAFNWSGGTLQVDNFAMTLDQNGGILAPGSSPGMSIITGDYNQADGAIYEVEINGFDQGDQTLADGIGYDFVDVSGAAVLDGVLKAVLIDGFGTGSGVFDVLTATSVTLGSNFTLDASAAAFSTAEWTTQVVSGGNGQILQLVVSIPLPTGGVMGLTLLGLLGMARRRA